MNDPEATTVIGADGWRGRVASPGGESAVIEIELPDGQRVLTRRESLMRRDDGSYYVPVQLKELTSAMAGGAQTGHVEAGQEIVVPVAREEVQVGTRQREKAEVVVHITPKLRQDVVELPVFQEEIEVKRVPVNRPVDRPPPVRQEGEVTIVPVLEEVLVVEKRLVVREEVHLIRHRRQRRERREVALREEEARVLRSDNGASKEPPEK